MVKRPRGCEWDVGKGCEGLIEPRERQDGVNGKRLRGYRRGRRGGKGTKGVKEEVSRNKTKAKKC